jgi:hypothetical protein
VLRADLSTSYQPERNRGQRRISAVRRRSRYLVVQSCTQDIEPTLSITSETRIASKRKIELNLPLLNRQLHFNNHRSKMNYLIAVLPDRIQAEAAYSALEKEGLPTDQVDILGQGYKNPDDFLLNPDRQAHKGVNRLIVWLIPFGFVAGYAFNVLSGIMLFPIGSFGNHILGGILGATAGALGAYFVGSIVGLTVGSGDALPYRNRLNARKYLVVVKGTEELTRQATRILRQFEPENIQGYTEPTGA